MRRILIFGNSASGKSTLAKHLCRSENMPSLDLDTVAWAPDYPPQRKALKESWKDIELFIDSNYQWVIEGCYSDLLDLILPRATEVIFMDLPIQACIANAKNRPWEPHKFETMQAQNENLAMLVDWIAQYLTRTDTFSREAHQDLYERFLGKKTIIKCNEAHRR